jgi:hypothetical protein
MDIDRKTLSYFILTPLLICFIANCKSTCIPDKFSFSGGSALFTPEKDSVRIGDTIKVDISLPKQYIFGSKNVDLSGAADMRTQINFDAIPKLDTLTFAVDSFLIIPKTGNFLGDNLSPHGQVAFDFLEEDNRYSFSMNIIAQKKGIYILTILDIFQAKKKCIDAKIAIQVTNSDPHLQYLEDVFHPGSPYEPSIPEIDKTHCYCFKVY